MNTNYRWRRRYGGRRRCRHSHRPCRHRRRLSPGTGSSAAGADQQLSPDTPELEGTCAGPTGRHRHHRTAHRRLSRPAAHIKRPHHGGGISWAGKRRRPPIGHPIGLGSVPACIVEKITATGHLPAIYWHKSPVQGTSTPRAHLNSQVGWGSKVKHKAGMVQQNSPP